MTTPSRNQWREAALELADILAQDDEVEIAYETGIRVGRFAAALMWPQDQRAAVEEARRAGLAEGFAQGVAFALGQAEQARDQQAENDGGDLEPERASRERDGQEAESC